MEPLTAYVKMRDGSELKLPFTGNYNNVRTAVSDRETWQHHALQFNDCNVVVFPGTSTDVRIVRTPIVGPEAA